MSRTVRFPLVAFFISLLVACEQAAPSITSPTSVLLTSSAVQAQMEASDRWGAAGMRTMTAETSSDFPCALGPFGPAERSHYTRSASGNETLVCTGAAASPAPEEIFKLSDFPCVLPSGTVTTDSRFLLTPSGHATLTCQAK